MKNFLGLSLIELLIAITVAAAAGALAINVLVSSGSLFVEQSSQISQGLSQNQSQFEISNLIKSASGIASQYPVSGSPQYVTDEDTLVLSLPAIDAQSDIIDSVFDYGVVEADSSNPKILRKYIFTDALSQRSSENKVLSTTLDDVTFLYLNEADTGVPPAQAVRISYQINLTDKTGNTQKESSSSSTVNLKNL